MRRAGRIIYNGAVVVSVLLLLVTAGVWVRSYWVSDMVYWCDWPSDYAYNHFRKAISSRGGLQLVIDHYEGNYMPAFETHGCHYSARNERQYPVLSDWYFNQPLFEGHRQSALGFAVESASSGSSMVGPQLSQTIKSLTLPLYFPTLLFALLPAHHFLRVRRRRRAAYRRAKGCCVFCGYDLRASAGRCPECGRETKRLTTDYADNTDEFNSYP
jgi:hypothetical protein